MLGRDPVQPTDQAFKAIYEHGFETWQQLYEFALRNRTTTSCETLSFDSLIANHPRVPIGASLDDDGFLTAKSLWSPGGSCDIPSFEQDFCMNTIISEATTVSLVKESSHGLEVYFGCKSHHLAVLLPAWAYVFSARWAVLISGMTLPTDTERKAAWLSMDDTSGSEAEERSIVQLGQISITAARWWSAVLASGSGRATTRLHNGDHLLSPWSISLASDNYFYLTSCAGSQEDANDLPPSFETATSYIQNYSFHHNIIDINQAAFAATLLLPLARLERRTVALPHPKFGPKKHRGSAIPV